MNTFITAMKIALAVIPEVLAVIQAVEVQGNGADKQSIVKQIILTAFQHFAPEEVVKSVSTDRLDSYVGKLIDIAVAFFNKIGLFKTSK